MISIEAHRTAIGRYYNKARLLSSRKHFNYCGCKKYEKDIYKLSHYTDSVMHKLFHNNDNNSSIGKEFTEKDLEFCIVTIEHVFDVSFLKILQLVIDGIESNPGPTQNIENTPSRGKGRPKKSRGFRGTPKKLIENISTVSKTNNDNNVPVGLVNIRNDCFFNSVIQALFTLESFRDHVRQFETPVSDELSAVNSIKHLFSQIEARQNNLIETHDFLVSINLPEYTENFQYDAEECMTYIVNLFYPRIDDRNNPEHNQVPKDSLFLLQGIQSTYCMNCNQFTNSNFNESLSQIEFPDYNFETSVQLKIDAMTNNLYGEKLDEPYQCEKCRSSWIGTPQNGTEATRSRNIININNYMIIQLKTFNYEIGRGSYKTIPPLRIEQQIENNILGKLNLRAIVFHIGDSPTQGHYVTCIKENNIWYRCNDSHCEVNENVKLNYDQIDSDRETPYLLIYERNVESDIPICTNVEKVEETTFTILENNTKDVDLNTDTYVICPHEDCNKQHVITSEDEIIVCDCGTVSSITFLEIFHSTTTEDMNQSKPVPSTNNPVKKNMTNLLKELDFQKNRVAQADKLKEKQDLLSKQISSAKKRILESKKQKRKIQSCLKELCTKQFLSYSKANEQKIQQLTQQISINDEEIKVADTEINSQLSSLSNMDTTPDSSRLKSPIKRKKKFTDNSSAKRMQLQREKLDNDAKSKVRAKNAAQRKSRYDALDDDTKARVQVKNTAQHKSRYDALNDDEKSKRQAKDAAQHKSRYDALDDNAKSKLQAMNTARRKPRYDTLDDDTKSKVQVKNAAQHKSRYDTLDNDAKSKLQAKNTAQHKVIRDNIKNIQQAAFLSVQGMSMADPSILKTDAYKLVKGEFDKAIKEGPDNECSVCLKLEFRRSVIVLDRSRYDTELFEKCYQKKSKWICKSCDKYMKKGKIPPQAQANDMYLCPRIEELDCLSYVECMLISQIIPFMFIVAKQKSSQDGLKGQCVLVPTDLTKIQTELPRVCDDNNIISLALKRRLSDKGSVHKQNINPNNVNKALEKLIEINPFYADVRIDESWANVSKDNDPETWDMLTNPNAACENYETDSDEELERNGRELEKKTTTNAFPTALQNKEGPEIDTNEILNIAPGEGQIPVSVRSEPDWEALAFPKEFSTGDFHYNHPRDIKITPIQYVQTRLKCSDNRFASNPQYLFSCLDWVERNAVASSINFTQRKQFQSEINVGNLLNSDHIQRMIGEDQMYASFKNIRGTPQYFHNMMLDILAKIRHFGPPTFFITCSAAEMGSWIEIIQTIARQFGTILTENEIENMHWGDKVMWIKRNPVTAARMIDDRFRQLFGKILYSGMHPVGKIINHDDRREFQGRGAQHPHATLHVEGAPRLDEDDDNVVTNFIDKYISCAIPDEKEYPELNKLVTTVQTHSHTQTCRKKKGVKCRFNFPLPPSDETRIVRKPDDEEDIVKEKKAILDTVLLNISNRTDLTDVTVSEILSECDVSEDDYYDALDYMTNKVTVVYKRKPREKNVSTYNPVVLSLMKSNMNIQFITGYYGLLKYLTSYMCKPERATSELMKKAAKEATNAGVENKLRAIGNVFITKREVSTDEAIVRTLSLPMRSSKIDTLFILTGKKENRIRALKPRSVLENMHPDDNNIYAPNILDKYAHRPDKPNEMKDMCLADFATMYVHHKAYEPQLESDDIRNYTTDISPVDVENDEESSKVEIITLKDDMGKMKKRKRPCVMRYHKVSKMSDPESYYFTLLQLYFPWRNEDELKGSFSSYSEMFTHVKSDIENNIVKHDPYFEKYELDFDDLENQLNDDNDDDSGPENPGEYNFVNPELIDLDLDQNTDVNANVQVGSSSVENRSIPREQCYEMCSKLNEKQLEIFYYVTRYAIEYMLNVRNDRILPRPIYVFLSGGGGVGKSYVSIVLIEMLRNILKFHHQDFDTQKSVAVTASTGIAATHLDGTTLHTAFNLPTHEKPIMKDGNALNTYQRIYKHLRILLHDEISMTGLPTFDDLNATLRKIKKDDQDFGGISIIAVGDLFQLPPVKMPHLYSQIHTRINDPWYRLFKLHELTEIVRQNNDPEFALLLNRLREGNHTHDDIEQMKELETTDISAWPEEVAHLFITNHLANTHNESCLSRLHRSQNRIYTCNAKDKGNIDVPEHVKHGDTKNLKKVLRLCEGAKVMITKNIDIADKVVNGTMGVILKIDRVRNDRNGYPTGTIYVKCDDPESGRKLKDPRLRGELKECIPIRPIMLEFKYKNVNVERMQFPLILAHAMTTHKSQGMSLDYYVGDLDRSAAPGKKGKPSCQPGLFYTMLSRGKQRTNIKLRNFDQSAIHVNKNALIEMQRMRKDSVLECVHPLMKLGDGSRMCLSNIVSWRKHIQHFLSDKTLSLHSSVFCFTETHNDGQFQRIKDFLPDWDDEHHTEGHGLAICFNTSKVTLLKRFLYVGALEILPLLLDIDDEKVLLVVLYRPGGPIADFVTCLIDTINALVRDDPIEGQYRTIILGDFNWDQLLPENVATFIPLCSHFNFRQRSNYSTHFKGGLLDLVFDDKKQTDVDWLFSPYSDHFTLLIDL